MKRLITLALFSALMIAGIQAAFAGPFGIEMGMNLAQVRQVCKTIPEQSPLEDVVYQITPLQTNALFEKYYIRIDPEYGVYWFKAIGRDIYTNDYGERLRATFESLVASIRKTYGEELYRVDEVQEDSVWGEPDKFMFALRNGDRNLYATWSRTSENIGIFLLGSLMKDPAYKDRVIEYVATNDTIALKTLAMEKALHYNQLPDDIESIYVGAEAGSTTNGHVVLEYNFSNSETVHAKADSVF